VKERPIICHIGIIGPLRIVGILRVRARDYPTEFSTPAGTIVPPVDPETRLMIVSGFQPISLDSTDRLRSEFAGARDEKGFNVGALEVDDVGIRRWAPTIRRRPAQSAWRNHRRKRP